MGRTAHAITIFLGISMLAGPSIAQSGPVGTILTPKGEYTGKLYSDDGDSFGVGVTFVRLAYVDAPERYSFCEAKSSGRVPCGIMARDELEDLIVQGVTCRAETTEKWNRWLSVCLTSDGIDVGLELTKRGWACVMPGAPANYFEVQATAQSTATGIWGTDYAPTPLCKARSRASTK